MSMSKKALDEYRASLGQAPLLKRGQVEETVPKWVYDAAKAVLAERERELLALKGPCSAGACRLHYAHSGPCNVQPNPPDLTGTSRMEPNR